MPTGYTAAIADGISFEQFALRCARAFGALITMRDDPSDAPIPDEFKPSDHYATWLADAQADLARLDAMTAGEAEAAAQEAFHKAEESRTKALAERGALRRKYLDMLGRAKAWTPPTEDHRGLQKFMCDQIRESIDFDCSATFYDTPTLRLTGEQWIAEERDRLQKSVAHYEEENAKELSRTAERNAWVKALRESLRSAKEAA